MSLTILSSTTDLSLDEVVELLKEHPDVDGVVLIGSGQTTDFRVASDYDLLIVLAEMPVQIRVGITHIGHRLTDLLFATVIEIDTILASDHPFNGEQWTGRIIRWCQTGRILFDRSGRLSRLKQKVISSRWISPAKEISLYQTWFGINYNFVQTRRMSQSQDPIYLLAVRMRLLYSLSDILGGYFVLRQLFWPGEKAAIQYLSVHDPVFLTSFIECLQESDLKRLLVLYEQLAAMATAPYGGLWAEEVTAFQIEDSLSPSEAGAQGALTWWKSLFEDKLSSDHMHTC